MIHPNNHIQMGHFFSDSVFLERVHKCYFYFGNLLRHVRVCQVLAGEWEEGEEADRLQLLQRQQVTEDVGPLEAPGEWIHYCHLVKDLGYWDLC